jgi:hypothetical protein
MDQNSNLKSSETLRLLCVSPEEPSWIAITMQLGSSGVAEPQFRWSSTPQEALTILRCEIFDAVLIVMNDTAREHEFDSSRVTRLLEAMRTSGHDEPVLLVTDALSGEEWAVCARLDCDIIASPDSWEAPALVPAVLRAVKRHALSRSLRQLEAANRKYTSRESHEAERFLNHLKQILTDQSLLKKSASAPERNPIPEELRALYRQLLRTFCMMGDGGLSAELTQLAEVLSSVRVSPVEILELHVRETRELVTRLGNRGASRMLLRADLLIIELMMIVGVSYRDQSIAAQTG